MLLMPLSSSIGTLDASGRGDRGDFPFRPGRVVDIIPNSRLLFSTPNLSSRRMYQRMVIQGQTLSRTLRALPYNNHSSYCKQASPAKRHFSRDALRPYPQHILVGLLCLYTAPLHYLHTYKHSPPFFRPARTPRQQRASCSAAISLYIPILSSNNSNSNWKLEKNQLRLSLLKIQHDEI